MSRNDKLYASIEELAKAAYALLDSPATGLTFRQAEAIARRVQSIIKTTDKIATSVSNFTATNATEFLKD